jgi:hypothetical protein
MNTCVETVPSQLPSDLEAEKPVAREPAAQGESANPAGFHSAPARQTITSTKRTWFSTLWPRARKINLEQSHLATLPVGSLPGIGQTYAKALVERGVTTIGQLCRIPKPVLVAAFGKGIGQHIWESARC